MYNEYFGLRQAPFRITPDTALFYTGGGRGDVLEALVYAITSGEGIVKVVGEVGTGKTMLCRMLEERLPGNVQIAYLANPSLTPGDILHAVALELELDLASDANRLQVMHRLQETLLARHASNQRVVVLVEEAQSMPVDTLEEIRLLSNLETKNEKLLQIVLFGQPELDENLGKTQIRQLRERITHSFALTPLGREEVKDYVAFRLRASGYRGRDAFTTDAYRAMSRGSEGLTRRVNIIADKAMLAAFADDTHDVCAKHVKSAIADSEFSVTRTRKPHVQLIAIAAVAVVMAAALGWYAGFHNGSQLGDGARDVAARGAEPLAMAAPASAALPQAEQQGALSRPIIRSPQRVAADGGNAPIAAATSAMSTDPSKATSTAKAFVSINSPTEQSASAIAFTEPLATTSAVATDRASEQLAAQSTTTAPNSTTVGSIASAVNTGEPAPMVRAPSGDDRANPTRGSPAPTVAATGIAAAAVAPMLGATTSEPRLSTSAAQSTDKLLLNAAPEVQTLGAAIGAETAQISPARVGPAAQNDVAKIESVVTLGPADAHPHTVTRAAEKSSLATLAMAQPQTATESTKQAHETLLDWRLAHTQQWLGQVSKSHYSIQLLATEASQRRNLEAFLARRERAGHIQQIFVFATQINAREWFSVLFGEFASYTQAVDALRELPAELQQRKPFIRNIKDFNVLS